MQGRPPAIVLLIVVVALMLVLVGPGQARAANSEKDTIKIGYLGTLSGPFGAVERYMTPAVEMVIENINTRGGLLGRKVELVVRDNQGDPSIVRQKLDELKAAGCVVVLGSILSPCCPPVSQWATDNKIPAIIPSPATFGLRTKGFSKYAFVTGPPAPALANVLFKSFVQQDIKSIYAIEADSDIALDVYKFLWAAMNKAKPDVKNLGSTTVGITEMEFSNVISAALAKKPDLILLGVAGPPYANFVQQARRFNLFQKTKVAAGFYILSAELLAAFGKNYPEGVMSNAVCPFYLKEKEMQDFTKSYFARTSLYPADITILWHVAALAAVEGIKKANSTDADKIVAALETVSFDTPVGKVRYRDFDHQAILPIFFATAGYSNEYPIAIGLNPAKHGEEVYPTKAEIMALRGVK
ncbi:MAG: ABC transporter substrate-binding protein [Syntrophorhabdales bacterium]